MFWLMNIIKSEEMTIAEFKSACEDVNKHVYGLIQDMKGSVSAEHGVGLIKKPYLGYTRSDAEIEIMKQIKQVFDPNNVINPGKLVDL